MQIKQVQKVSLKKFSLEQDSYPWPLLCQYSALQTEPYISSQLEAGDNVSL